MIKLRRLSDVEYGLAEDLARMEGIPLDTCPTCGSTSQSVGIEHYGRENGRYRYKGRTYPCDCEMQIALRKHYLVANIGKQYQTLDWRNYHISEAVRDSVEQYLDHWAGYLRLGMGLEFYSKSLGTGKTWAATAVGKFLIQRGQMVYFIAFGDLLTAYDDGHDVSDLEERLRTTTYLIIDEIKAPDTERQRTFFSQRLETIIRHRTNFNLPNITTTNMTPSEMWADYPRIYSLLEPKQTRIEMPGSDIRLAGDLKNINQELVKNNEVAPII